MWSWMGLALADSPILPLRAQDEAVALNLFTKDLEEKYNPLLVEHGISLGTNITCRVGSTFFLLLIFQLIHIVTVHSL